MVNHNILLQKLDTYGIRGIAHQWVASYLKNRKQLVEIDHLNLTTHEIQQKRSEEKIIQTSPTGFHFRAVVIFNIYE